MKNGSLYLRILQGSRKGRHISIVPNAIGNERKGTYRHSDCAAGQYKAVYKYKILGFIEIDSLR
jgi:hypothetical protein